MAEDSGDSISLYRSTNFGETRAEWEGRCKQNTLSDTIPGRHSSPVERINNDITLDPSYDLDVSESTYDRNEKYDPNLSDTGYSKSEMQHENIGNAINPTSNKEHGDNNEASIHVKVKTISDGNNAPPAFGEFATPRLQELTDSGEKESVTSLKPYLSQIQPIPIQSEEGVVLTSKKTLNEASQPDLTNDESVYKSVVDYFVEKEVPDNFSGNKYLVFEHVENGHPKQGRSHRECPSNINECTEPRLNEVICVNDGDLIVSEQRPVEEAHNKEPGVSKIVTVKTGETVVSDFGEENPQTEECCLPVSGRNTICKEPDRPINQQNEELTITDHIHAPYEPEQSEVEKVQNKKSRLSDTVKVDENGAPNIGIAESIQLEEIAISDLSGEKKSNEESSAIQNQGKGGITIPDSISSALDEQVENVQNKERDSFEPAAVETDENAVSHFDKGILSRIEKLALPDFSKEENNENQITCAFRVSEQSQMEDVHHEDSALYETVPVKADEDTLSDHWLSPTEELTPMYSDKKENAESAKPDLTQNQRKGEFSDDEPNEYAGLSASIPMQVIGADFIQNEASRIESSQIQKKSILSDQNEHHVFLTKKKENESRIPGLENNESPRQSDTIGSLIDEEFTSPEDSENMFHMNDHGNAKALTKKKSSEQELILVQKNALSPTSIMNTGNEQRLNEFTCVKDCSSPVFEQSLVERDQSKESHLPYQSEVITSGFALARVTLKSLLSKKWRPVYWVRYGLTSLYVFRSKEDFDAWLTNPTLTKRQRNSLLKWCLPFFDNMTKTNGVRGFRCTDIKSKTYKTTTNQMLQFKLEKWTDMGVRNIAAFASESKCEVDALKDCIETCLSKCPNNGLQSIDDLLVSGKPSSNTMTQ